jgi:uncharacterized coiled-coil protein SlyX
MDFRELATMRSAVAQRLAKAEADAARHRQRLAEINQTIAEQKALVDSMMEASNADA